MPQIFFLADGWKFWKMLSKSKMACYYYNEDVVVPENVKMLETEMRENIVNFDIVVVVWFLQ